MVIVEWIINGRRMWLGREKWTLEAVVESLSRAGWDNVTVEMHAKRTTVIVIGGNSKGLPYCISSQII